MHKEVNYGSYCSCWINERFSRMQWYEDAGNWYALLIFIVCNIDNEFAYSFFLSLNEPVNFNDPVP